MPHLQYRPNHIIKLFSLLKCTSKNIIETIPPFAVKNWNGVHVTHPYIPVKTGSCSHKSISAATQSVAPNKRARHNGREAPITMQGGELRKNFSNTGTLKSKLSGTEPERRLDQGRGKGINNNENDWYCFIIRERKIFQPGYSGVNNDESCQRFFREYNYYHAKNKSLPMEWDEGYHLQRLQIHECYEQRNGHYVQWVL